MLPEVSSTTLLKLKNDGPNIAVLQGSTGNGKDTSPEGPDSIPKFGSMGGIDAKTGAPPASIHESSIGDISSGAKQNFPQDPISHGIGSGSATHGAHGASPYGGEGLPVCKSGNHPSRHLKALIVIVSRDLFAESSSYFNGVARPAQYFCILGVLFMFTSQTGVFVPHLTSTLCRFCLPKALHQSMLFLQSPVYGTLH